MSAVPKPALFGQSLDVAEYPLDPFLIRPEPELAHAGRIDDDAAAGTESARGVSSCVGHDYHLSHGVHQLSRFAEQRVDEARLADARHTETPP